MLKINQINEFITIGLLDLDEFASSKKLLAKREIEQFGTNYLLQNLFPSTEIELHYTENKKPFLKENNYFISISHSHQWLAIIKETRVNTGIDVELIREKILTIKHKFLNKDEEKFCANNLTSITFVWSIKETLYKIFGVRGIDFKQDMAVAAFAISDNKTSASIRINNNFHIFEIALTRFDNYCLTYVLNEIQ